MSGSPRSIHILDSVDYCVSPNFTMPRAAVEQQKGLNSADFLDYSDCSHITAPLLRLILIRVVEASQIDAAALLFFEQPQSSFNLFHPPRQHRE
jgi:hypothetical protein